MKVIVERQLTVSQSWTHCSQSFAFKGSRFNGEGINDCLQVKGRFCAGVCSDILSNKIENEPGPGKKRNVEALWRDFFSNTTQWWDHRAEKINPRFPDFRHKQTRESLWLDNARNPQWVQAELAEIPPGTLQCNTFVWTQRLKRHVKAREYRKTLEVFRQMQQERIHPDCRTFIPVLNACAGLGALNEGRCVHTQIIQVGCELDVYVANCLVDMYTKSGSIEDAWNVFKKMGQHNVVTWNTIIGGCAKSGQELKAIELFQKMQQEGMKPDAVTFVGVLTACASVAAVDEGRRLHEQIIRGGWESNIYVDTCLVDMYAKCGSIEDARSVFDKMHEHNVVTWNAMIGGYMKSGEGLKAIKLFKEMQREGVKPNAVTFVGLLNACASVAALEEGRYIHSEVIEAGHEADVYVATCLVDMYAKCGSIEDAWSVFSKMPKHDVVTWSAMIVGYVESGQGWKAMKLFWKMPQEGVKPNSVTFVGMLNACASVAALEEGRRVHTEIIRRGCESNVYVVSCLVEMYAKCGSIEDAWSVFNKIGEHDVVSWNAMIGGFVKSDQGLKAIELFRKMRKDGVEPNSVTYVGLLSACASVGALEEGSRLHTHIIQAGCESDVHVATCLVDMYAKCGSLEDAWSVFSNMREHNVVTWNGMIGGYLKSGQGLRAIELYQRMREEGVEPDDTTFIGVLNACASVAALTEGRHVHKQIIEVGRELDVNVATCLVDMYAKCGSIEDAWSVFNKMGEHDIVTWNAIIGGHAMHGQGKEAIGLFKRMGKESIEVNSITFTCLLSACSHGGLVKEGLHYFKSMSLFFDIVPNTGHYSCMVDLLGRAGWLEEAEELINRMPLETDLCVWMSLLGACRIHGNIEMAERAAKRCWELDPGNASGYVLLSNVYAAV